VKSFFFDLPPYLQHPVIEKGGKRYVLTYQYYEQDNTYHRMPNWMSPKLHLVIEDVLTKIPGMVVKTPLGVFYHILFGLICNYTMKDILAFLKRCYFGSN